VNEVWGCVGGSGVFTLTSERHARGKSWGVGGSLSARSVCRGRGCGGCGEGDRADGWGPRVSEGDARTDGLAPTRRTPRAEREGRERARAGDRISADRAGPPGRERAQARAWVLLGQMGRKVGGGVAGLIWVFSLISHFLTPFPFPF
jgi:hypothetical protein